MNELVIIRNNDIFTDSLVISKGTGNKHINVKELITDYKKEFLQLGTLSVLNRESTGGRPEKYYLLNEQQATFLMTLLRNNKVTVKFKLELVKQFYKMRQLLLEKQTIQWQETRLILKSNRKLETDEIKQLIELAKSQGSKNMETKAYIIYFKLANKICGINNRDTATTQQLNNLVLVENIIKNCIKEGINNNENYRTIYANCKDRLKEFLKITYLQLASWMCEKLF